LNHLSHIGCKSAYLFLLYFPDLGGSILVATTYIFLARRMLV